MQSAPASIIGLKKNFGVNSIFTLNCTSTGSPATTVIWTKDGEQLSMDRVYETFQFLESRLTATYVNHLSVNSGPYGVTGEYNCIVENSLGNTSEITLVTGTVISNYLREHLEFSIPLSMILTSDDFV